MKTIQQLYIVTFVLGACCTSLLYASSMNNRYLPWMSSAHAHAKLDEKQVGISAFMMLGDEAYRIRPGVGTNEQTTAFPNLRGVLKLSPVNDALALMNMTSPMPLMWRSYADFTVDFDASIQAQGATFFGYFPVTSHFALGGSFGLVGVHSEANMFPSEETVNRLGISTSGDKVRFATMLAEYEKLLGSDAGFWSDTGVTDIDLFAKWFRVDEYAWHCKRIDSSVTVGVVAPTGHQKSYDHIASIPLGSDGFWALYIEPSLFMQLRSQLAFFASVRLQKPFSREQDMRIPLAFESQNFAPLFGKVYVRTGTLFNVTMGLLFDDIRAGLGLGLQYSVTKYNGNWFEDRRENKTVAIDSFGSLITQSSFVQEYCSIKVYYDIAHERAWKIRPTLALTWDIPKDVFGSRGVHKTHKVSLDVNIDF